jgi:hypothetical protein
MDPLKDLQRAFIEFKEATHKTEEQKLKMAEELQKKMDTALDALASLIKSKEEMSEQAANLIASLNLNPALEKFTKNLEQFKLGLKVEKSHKSKEG